MTRLTELDVHDLARKVVELDRGLQEVCGVDLRSIALRAAGSHGDDRFIGARVAAVPFTSGRGAITGFSRGVVAIVRHLGCDAWVTAQPDIRGLREAVQAGAEVLFVADDDCFIALSVRHGVSADNDTATGSGYATALAAAAGGLEGRRVLVLGLGPVGWAATQRLLELGAVVVVVEPDESRLRQAVAVAPDLRSVSLSQGLASCDLILDATPEPGFITAAMVTPSMIAAVPGLPSGFTPEAQALLGPRHLHDPLAVGVAVMAALALAPCRP